MRPLDFPPAPLPGLPSAVEVTDVVIYAKPTEGFARAQLWLDTVPFGPWRCWAHLYPYGGGHLAYFSDRHPTDNESLDDRLSELMVSALRGFFESIGGPVSAPVVSGEGQEVVLCCPCCGAEHHVSDLRDGVPPCEGLLPIYGVQLPPIAPGAPVDQELYTRGALVLRLSRLLGHVKTKGDSR